MFGGINIVLFVFVWFLIPETKGVALEHMDHLFGGVDHTDKGAEMLDVKRFGGNENEPTVETEERVVDDERNAREGDAREGGAKVAASK